MTGLAGRPMMSSRFRWSGVERSPRKVALGCQDELPIVLVTRDGYSGRDTHMHQYDANEVFWVYAVERQIRFVLCDDEGNFITVPKSYSGHFHIRQRDGRTTEKMSLAEAVIHSGGRADIVFAGDTPITAYQGAGYACPHNLGPLAFRDVYDQFYMIGHPLDSDTLLATIQVFPDYMPLEVDTAVGLHHGTDHQYRDMMRTIQDIADSFEHKTPSIDEDIIVFDSAPDSPYEDPMALVRMINKPGGDVPKEEPRDTNVLPVPPRPRKATVIHQMEPTLQEIWSREVVPTKYRLFFPPPPPPDDDGDDVYEDVASLTAVSSTSGQSRPAQPAPECADRPYRLAKASHHDVSKTHNKVLTKTAAFPSATSKQNPRMSKSNAWTDLSQVPSIVAELDVEDVTRCLGLLGLEKHAARFAAEKIDGAFLATTDDTTLIDVFGLSRLEVRKIIQFSQHGWRPKK